LNGNAIARADKLTKKDNFDWIKLRKTTKIVRDIINKLTRKAIRCRSGSRRSIWLSTMTGGTINSATSAHCQIPFKSSYPNRSPVAQEADGGSAHQRQKRRHHKVWTPARKQTLETSRFFPRIPAFARYFRKSSQ